MGSCKSTFLDGYPRIVFVRDRPVVRVGCSLRVIFCCVCAAGLSEPPTLFQSILWPIIDHILVNFGKYVIFAIPT